MKISTIQESGEFVTSCVPENDAEVDVCEREIKRQLIERGDVPQTKRDVSHSSHDRFLETDGDTTRTFRLRVIVEEVPET